MRINVDTWLQIWNISTNRGAPQEDIVSHFITWWMSQQGQFHHDFITKSFSYSSFPIKNSRFLLKLRIERAGSDSVVWELKPLDRNYSTGFSSKAIVCPSFASISVYSIRAFSFHGLEIASIRSEKRKFSVELQWRRLPLTSCWCL